MKAKADWRDHNAAILTCWFEKLSVLTSNGIHAHVQRNKQEILNNVLIYIALNIISKTSLKPNAILHDTEKILNAAL